MVSKKSSNTFTNLVVMFIYYTPVPIDARVSDEIPRFNVIMNDNTDFSQEKW